MQVALLPYRFNHALPDFGWVAHYLCPFTALFCGPWSRVLCIGLASFCFNHSMLLNSEQCASGKCWVR